MSETFATIETSAYRSRRPQPSYRPKMLTRKQLDIFLWDQVEQCLGGRSPTRAAVEAALFQEIADHS